MADLRAHRQGHCGGAALGAPLRAADSAGHPGQPVQRPLQPPLFPRGLAERLRAGRAHDRGGRVRLVGDTAAHLRDGPRPGPGVLHREPGQAGVRARHGVRRRAPERAEPQLQHGGALAGHRPGHRRSGDRHHRGRMVLRNQRSQLHSRSHLIVPDGSGRAPTRSTPHPGAGTIAGRVRVHVGESQDPSNRPDVGRRVPAGVELAGRAAGLRSEECSAATHRCTACSSGSWAPARSRAPSSWPA